MTAADDLELQRMKAEYADIRAEIERLSRVPVTQLPTDNVIMELVNRSSYLRAIIDAREGRTLD